MLLQRIKVQPSKQFQLTNAISDGVNAKRKRGRMVRRRRRKKNIANSDDIFYGESDGGHETSAVPGLTDKVYFTPL